MNLTEFEEILKKHGKSAPAHLELPFMLNFPDTAPVRRCRFPVVLLAVLAACLFAVTAFAAYRIRTASEAADALADESLSAYFEGVEAVSETIIDGDYQATLLGVVPGNEMAVYSRLHKPKGKCYAVVAIARTDGTPMTEEDAVLVSPPFEGYAPAEKNIYTLSGECRFCLIDGVRYQIVTANHADAFDSGRVYIAVTDGVAPGAELYDFDAETGDISVNEMYAGTNILFSLPQEPK